MTVKTFSNPKSLQDIWNNIYEKDEHATPFMSYNAQVYYYKVFKFQRFRFIRKPCYFCVEDGGNRHLILACSKFKNTLYDITDLSPIDYFDIITDTHDEKFIKKALYEIWKSSGCSHLKLYHANSYGNFVSSFPEIKNGKLEICVEIKFQSKFYDDYYSGLSKHQRQNLRTAYNRLNKEDIPFKIVKYSKDNIIDKNVYKQCQLMYEKRCDNKNNPKLAKIRNFMHRFNNPVNGMLKCSTGKTIFVLYFFHNPVAYMAGFLSEDKKTYYVPRLSTNNCYLKYSTGIIMLNESIKILLNEGVTRIDLTRGNEQYKYAMGGTEHYDYQYDLNLDRLEKYNL